MFLIAGLGNRGERYKQTRHNVGFMAADSISKCYNFTWNHKPKFSADITSGNIDKHKVVICKPATFMNLSGVAILAIMSYYNIELKNLIVLHDDIDLDLGKIKCKTGGSNAGHNGLKSIDEKVGRDYFRVRIGIGRPNNNKMSIANYVLSDFFSEELEIIYNKCKVITQSISLLLASEMEKFQFQVNN